VEFAFSDYGQFISIVEKVWVKECFWWIRCYLIAKKCGETLFYTHIGVNNGKVD